MKDWKELKPHKLNQFPAMQDWEFEELKKSVAKGFDKRMPIVVYVEDNGDKGIIDGANRHRACVESNIIPLIREFYGTYKEAMEFILKTNVRRNLSAGQKAAVVLDMDEVINELVEAAAKSMQATQFKSKDDGRCTNAPATGRTSEIVANTANVSRRTVDQAIKVKEADPELYEHVKQGTISASAAYDRVKEREIEADEKLSIQRRAKRLLRDAVAVALDRQKEELYQLALQTVEDTYNNGLSEFDFELKITKI